MSYLPVHRLYQNTLPPRSHREHGPQGIVGQIVYLVESQPRGVGYIRDSIELPPLPHIHVLALLEQGALIDAPTSGSGTYRHTHV